MYSILIKSESRFPINRKRIKVRVINLLKGQGLNPETEISLAFIGRRKIRKLNRQFRHLDEVGAVLSFSQLEGQEKFIGSPGEKLILGDIVICYPEAQRLANQEEMLVDDEIDRLIEHGLGNLLKINF